MTLPEARPKPRERTRSTLTRSPSSAPPAVGPGDVQFAAGLLLVDRNQPPAAAGQGAEDSEHAGLGVIDDLDDAAAIDGASRRARRAFRRATARGRRRRPRCPAAARRGTWMRIFGGSPLSTSSHSAGVAINSPSLSRPVMSAITVGGRAAGSLIFLPRLVIVPSSASSRRMRFSSTRSAFLRPNSRAISRVPTFPGCARMKATMASRLGKPLSRCFGHSIRVCLAGALLGDGLCAPFGGVRSWRCRHRRPRLAVGFRISVLPRLFSRPPSWRGFVCGLAGRAAYRHTWPASCRGLVAVLVGLVVAAFLAPRSACRRPWPRARRSARSLRASVMVSWVLSLGIVALTPPAVT